MAEKEKIFLGFDPPNSPLHGRFPELKKRPSKGEGFGSFSGEDKMDDRGLYDLNDLERPSHLAFIDKVIKEERASEEEPAKEVIKEKDKK